jgi:hypothetical protein
MSQFFAGVFAQTQICNFLNEEMLWLRLQSNLKQHFPGVKFLKIFSEHTTYLPNISSERT